MPLPFKNVRYAYGKPFEKDGEEHRERFAFEGNEVVEVTDYVKKDGKLVKSHTRSHPENASGKVVLIKPGRRR